MNILIVHPSSHDRATGINAQAYAEAFVTRGHGCLVLSEGTAHQEPRNGVPWARIDFEGPFLTRALKRRIASFQPDIVWLMGARLLAGRAALEALVISGGRLIYHAEDCDETAFRRSLGEGEPLEALTGLDTPSPSAARLQEVMAAQNWPRLMAWLADPRAYRGIEPVSRLACRWVAAANTAIWVPLRDRLAAETGKPTYLAPAVVTDRDLHPPRVDKAAVRQGLARHGLRDEHMLVFMGGTAYAGDPDLSTFLQAMRIAAAERSLFLCHAGAMTPEAAQLVARTLGEAVPHVCLGFVDDAVYAALTVACDAFACPGSDSAFNRWRLPSRVVRPMAAGVPVILGRRGFGESLTHGRNAILTEGDDPAAWAESLALLDDPLRRESIGAAGRVFAAEHLHVATIVDTLEAAFLGLTGDAPGDARTAAPASPSASHQGTSRMHGPTLLLPCVTDYDTSTWIGGKVYLQNLLHTLSSLPDDERPRVFIVRISERADRFIETLAMEPCVAGILDARGLPRALRRDVEAEVLRDGKLDLGRMQALMQGVVASFPVMRPRDDLPRPVYWIPDLQHRRLPEMFSPEEAARRDETYGAIARQDAPVILSSQDAAADFARFFPDARARARVWSFVSALDARSQVFTDPRPDHGLPSRFLYVPNQFWKHKDFETVIRALHLLKERGHDVTVAVTGPTEDHRHPGYYAAMIALARDLGVDDRFRHLGLLDRDRQLDVFRAAAAILQPSRFEGWSTVIEDAKAVGRPILCSDIPIHREQVGDDGRYFPLGDADALADLIATFLPDLAPGPDDTAERRAAERTAARRQDQARAFLRAVGAPAAAPRPAPAPAPNATAPAPAAATDGPLPRAAWAGRPLIDGPHALRVERGRTQWYDPAFGNAASIGARHWSGGFPRVARDFLERIDRDDYAQFLHDYLSAGLERFGDDWRFADIVSVLLCLSDVLRPRRYLEIGVRRGRSACAVAARTPGVDMVLCDMWVRGYAGMDNPGPDFVRAQLRAIGHGGAVEMLNGDSHVEVPRFLAAHPEAGFDLITVDGDHSRRGAADDLVTVLPALTIGGAVVFDDIAHPKHPELAEVWREVVERDDRMTTWSFRELGYGVGFAVRMR